MSTDAKRLVAAGVAFMHKHDPGWWREDADPAISLEMLEMSLGDRCTLGQRCPLTVLARYQEAGGEDARGDRHDPYFAYAAHLAQIAGADGESVGYWAAQHGFTATLYTSSSEAVQYAALTAEWRRVITELRAAS